MESPRPLPIRTVFIDDHAIVRTALRMFLETRPQFRVVGEAGNPSEALAMTAREQPDVIVLNLDLGDTSGLDLLPDLLVTASAARVLILTGGSDPYLHRQAVSLGAMGVLIKGQSLYTLMQAIEKIHAGEMWIEPWLLPYVSDVARNEMSQRGIEEAKIARLTTREREVIRLMGEGLRDKQIARHISISQTTVRHHVSMILRKLEVTDRTALVIYAYRHGLAKPPP